MYSRYIREVLALQIPLPLAKSKKSVYNEFILQKFNVVQRKKIISLERRGEKMLHFWKMNWIEREKYV